MSARDERVAELYSLPLDEFTAARNALAAELTKGGDRDGAAAVRSLKKPSVPAWAVNQLARVRTDDMAALIDLRERMNGASADELRAASAERRRLIAALVKEAERILAGAGHAASSSTMERITQTLQAGADAEEQDLLRSGRLTHELAPAGFGGFELSDAMSARPASPSKATERARKRVDELFAAADEKADEARELENAAELARKHAEAAARQAEVARRDADRARARAEAAAAKLER